MRWHGGSGSVGFAIGWRSDGSSVDFRVVAFLPFFSIRDR